MEEARISGAETSSMVSTDDLLMLIGARTVEALNYERLFKDARQKAGAAQELQKRIGELERSLREASDHSASLDRALTDARRQAQAATKRAEDAEKKAINLEQARTSLGSKLEIAQEEIGRLREEIKTMSSKKRKKK